MSTDVPGPDRVGSENGDGGGGGGPVVVPVLDTGSGERAVDVGCALSQQRGGELLLVSPDVGAGTTPFPLLHGTGVERDDRRRELAERVRERANVPVAEEVRHGLQASRVVADAAADHDADVVVVEGGTREPPGRLGPATVDRIARNAPCDVLVVNGAPPFGDVSSVLLGVAGGPHSWCAAGVARDLAAAEGAWVDVFHVVSPDADEWRRCRGRRLIGTAIDRFDDRETVDEWLYEADDVVDALVEQSRYYDLTIIGAPRKSRLRRFVSRSTVSDVRRSAVHGTVTVHRDDDGA